jgi:hypothetical protein
VRDNILYQDNKSAVLLETNGRASSSKRTKHINIRYYYVADRVSKGRFKDCLVSYGQDDCRLPYEAFTGGCGRGDGQTVL